MTTRINLLPYPIDTFEQARRAELERLTGCPIHHVIEGTCREPGCVNAALQLQKEFVLPSYARDAAPIFQTKPRLRCVL